MFLIRFDTCHCFRNSRVILDGFLEQGRREYSHHRPLSSGMEIPRSIDLSLLGIRCDDGRVLSSTFAMKATIIVA